MLEILKTFSKIIIKRTHSLVSTLWVLKYRSYLVTIFKTVFEKSFQVFLNCSLIFYKTKVCLKTLNILTYF